MKRFLSVLIVVLAAWGVLGVEAQPPSMLTRPAEQDTPKPATPATPGQSAQQPKPAAQPATQPSAQPVAQPAAQLAAQPVAQPAAAQPTKKRIVDFEADKMRPIKLANDSTALSLQGKVVFYHNGAVITCDSAVRYSDKRMECFFNVVINKQKTYIYGDRADYNGEINTARVYAPIIKIVDDDVVMHCYDFAFNTLTNIGQYTKRGTVTQKDNLLESMRGYYYSDTREVICVQNVQLKNETYKLKSDSVRYNMNTEVAEFFVKSYIWNKNSEILSAEVGLYDSRDSSYHFTRDAYVLTKNQELWSDTLDYNSQTEDAVLHRNIQMRDDEQQVISFGDYGLYWGKREEAMLTIDPQMLNFDAQQKEDTLYIRSDSMFLYTVSREAAEQVKEISDSSKGDELIVAPGKKAAAGEPLEPAPGEPDAAVPPAEAVSAPAADSGLQQVDRQVIATDSIAGPQTSEGKMEALDAGNAPPSKREQRALEKEQKRLADEAEKALREAAKKEAAEKKEADRKLPKGEVSIEEHDHDHGHDHAADSLALRAAAAADSVKRVAVADSTLQANREKTDSLLIHGKTEKPDSMVRITRAYRNVRIFRSDFQAVCDSLVTFSIDSTAHLYIDPVMWNGANQIKSEIVDLYTKDQRLTKAVFTGEPIMSSEVDTTKYNQVKGKVIEAFFRNNEIFRTDVNGNGQTLYYMTEEDSLKNVDVVGFLVAECANISFDIENKQVIRITYKGNPVYSIYPMDKIPEEQETRLPGFVWEAHRKPVLEDVFTRQVKPSQREEYEAMKEPWFPLTEQIMNHREQMIKNGEWRDRNDVISEEAWQFIRSLGY